MFQNQRLMEKIKTNLVLMDKMILFFVYSLVTISTIFVYKTVCIQCDKISEICHAEFNLDRIGNISDVSYIIYGL